MNAASGYPHQLKQRRIDDNSPASSAPGASRSSQITLESLQFLVSSSYKREKPKSGQVRILGRNEQESEQQKIAPRSTAESQRPGAKKLEPFQAASSLIDTAVVAAMQHNHVHSRPLPAPPKPEQVDLVRRRDDVDFKNSRILNRASSRIPVMSPGAAAKSDLDPSAKQGASDVNLPPEVEAISRECPDISKEHLQRIAGTVVTIKNEVVIAGLEAVKDVIMSKIVRPILRPDLHKGLYRAVSGILFFGPPGTGKTSLAKWIAYQAKATFFCVTPSVLVSMFQGESESLIKCLFVMAERLSPAIIFFDEIDGFIGKRSLKEEESTLRMKNQLLQAMDGLCTQEAATVIVIGATNRPDALDDAALRRLQKRIYIPLPDDLAIYHQIKNTLIKHAQDLEICRCDTACREAIAHTCVLLNYDFESLRTVLIPRVKGFNGSDIRALCVKAAEILYQNVLFSFDGDLDKVPNPSAFGLPTIDHFQKALSTVRPSTTLDSTTLNQWASDFACF